MILVVLLVMMLSVALLIFVTWRALGIIERMAASAGLEKSIPVFGILSIAATVLGFLGVAIGIGADTGAGVALALFALGFGPLLGIGFGLAALIYPRASRGPSSPRTGWQSGIRHILLVEMILTLTNRCRQQPPR